MSATLDADALGALLDAAAGLSHVDLGPILGMDDLRVSVSQLGALLSGGAPSFTLSHDGASLTVTPTGGGGTVTLEIAP